MLSGPYSAELTRLGIVLVKSLQVITGIEP